jgi:hypothetical protein
MMPPGYPGFIAVGSFWIVMGLVAYLRHYLQAGQSDPSILFESVVWLACFAPWVGLTPLVFRLERRYPLRRPGWARNTLILAAIGIPVTYMATAVVIGLSTGLYAAVRDQGSLPDPWWAIPFRELAVQQALYWTAVAGSSMIRRFIELHEQERRSTQLALENSQLEASLHRAEINAIAMRIRPHFLFNSLQNISVLTREDPTTASRMLAHLGDVLRQSLRRDTQPETTLDSEVELAKAYVAIEQMRFGDRLSVRLELDPGTHSALVPTLLLQPLIENAILHGLKNVRHAGVIAVTAQRHDRDLVITVTDNGAGLGANDLSQLEMGIGLGSTHERLQRMYPGRHAVSARSRREGGAEVRIVLPFRDVGIPDEARAS